MIRSRHVLIRLLPACAAVALIGALAAACSEHNTTPVSPTVEFHTPASGASAPATTVPSSAASAGPSSSASAGPSSSSGASTTIQITAKDSKFDKSSLTVPAGAKVTLKMTNDDSIIHNFAVYDTKGGKELYTGDLFKGPNVTKTETFTAPAKPGKYYFQCDVHPDTMNGTLTVQ